MDLDVSVVDRHLLLLTGCIAKLLFLASSSSLLIFQCQLIKATFVTMGTFSKWCYDS